MGNIINFPKSKATKVDEFLIETFDIAKESDVDSVIVCLKLKNGEVMTGYFNSDFGARQEMLGHIQCDVIDQMILANLERYKD